LVSFLESFQSLLLKNQEKLELYRGKEFPNSTVNANAAKRYF
jgi:hypothetical protein